MKSILLTSLMALAATSLLPAQTPPLLISFGSTSVTNPTNDAFHQQSWNTTYTTWNCEQNANASSGLVYGDGSTATGVSMTLGAGTGTSVSFSTLPSNAGSPGMGAFTQSPYTTSFTAGSPGTNAIWHGGTSTITSIAASFGGLPAGTYQVFVTGVDTGNNNTPQSPGGTEVENFYYSATTGVPSGTINTGTLVTTTVPKPFVETLNLTDTYPWLTADNYITFTVTLTAGQNLNIFGTGAGTSIANAYLNSIAIVPAADMTHPLLYGLNTHEELDTTGYFTTIPATSLISLSGANAIRDSVSWQECDPNGTGNITIPPAFITYINNEIAAGVSPLIVFAYGNTNYDSGYYPTDSTTMQAYANYCKAIVTQFKGKVKYYQVWNEWNNRGTMPTGCPSVTMAQYVPLLQLVYPQIKAIDPSIVVLSDAIDQPDNWVQEFVEDGGTACSDAIDIHTYPSYAGGTPDTFMETWYTRLLAEPTTISTKNNGQPFPVTISEMGFPTCINGYGVTEEQQAEFLSRTYFLAATMPYLRLLDFYEFRDTVNNYESSQFSCNQGLMRPDATPKLSWAAMQDTMTLLNGATFTDRINVNDPNVFLLRYKQTNGNYFIVAWSEWAEDDWQLYLKAPTALPVNEMVVGHGEMQTAFSTSAHNSSPALSLTIRRDPTVIEGAGLQNVTFWQISKISFNETLRTPNPPSTTSPYLPLGNGMPFGNSTNTGSNVSPY